MSPIVTPTDDEARAVWADYLALCDCGGRLAGSASEAEAFALLRQRLGAIPGGHVQEDSAGYAAWRCERASLIDIASGDDLACTPLLGTAAATDLEAEVYDLGLGRPDDFAAHRGVIAGRIVLVRHEYPFATGHVHRRVKLGLAQEAGAVGFLIAHPESGVGPVSGSSGRNGGPGIPALGVGAATVARFARRTDGTLRRARMTIVGHDFAARAPVLILDFPGQSDGWIVLSAHVDGHPHGESAIDNATGVAVALGVARMLAPHAPSFKRGLRLCLFSAEEWGLAGSRQWIAAMDARERARMRLNINLDSVGGAVRLAALTSGFPALGAWIERCAQHAGETVAIHLPLMPNSDHANFAAAGIPAFRLLAGFDDPQSNLRLLLTARDTRSAVRPEEMNRALRVAAALAFDALTAPDEQLAALGRTE